MIENHKCPNCSAPLSYDTETGMLVCGHCGGSYPPETAPEKDSGLWDCSGLESWDGKELSMYSCPSCAAELICHRDTAATFCPYCGNHAVIRSSFEAGFKPDYIIPFKLNSHQAQLQLKQHFTDRTLLPRKFGKEGVLDKVRGVYLPYWLFDGMVWGKINYEATTKQLKSNYQGDVRITRHYRVRRGGNMRFEKVPVDASSRIPDKYTDSIEPFNYSGLRKFSTGYLPGFYADKYDLSPEDCEEKAMDRCRQSLRMEMEKTLSGYDSFSFAGENVGVRKGQVHYALFPVWLLSVRWRGKRWLYAVNGQTGKTAGEVPVDYARAVLRFMGICAGISAIGSAITWLIVH